MVKDLFDKCLIFKMYLSSQFCKLENGYTIVQSSNDFGISTMSW